MSLRNDDSGEGANFFSSQRISELRLGYHICRLDRTNKSPQLNVDYSPLIQNTDMNFSEVRQLSGGFGLRAEDLPIEIQQRIVTLQKVVASSLPRIKLIR